MLGTPSYMPPEQAEGATSETDARADIFSLGAIVYEAISGRMAFEGPTVPSIILKVCFQEPEPLQSIAPHLPPTVIKVIMRALRKTPGERHQSVRELFEDYRAALEAAPSPALPQPFALAETVLSAAPPSPFSAKVSAPDPDKVATTLSGAAAELHPVDLPTMGTGTGSRGRWRIVAVAVAALVVIGGTAAFLTFRGYGGGQPSAGASPPQSDAGSPPSTKTTTTSPIPHALHDAGLPAASSASDAGVTPRPARPRTMRPRRTMGRPKRPASMRPIDMRPSTRRTAAPARPRPPRPMVRRPPRRKTPMRRVPPRPHRRRSSKWAT